MLTVLVEHVQTATWLIQRLHQTHSMHEIHADTILHAKITSCAKVIVCGANLIHLPTKILLVIWSHFDSYTVHCMMSLEFAGQSTASNHEDPDVQHFGSSV